MMILPVPSLGTLPSSLWIKTKKDHEVQIGWFQLYTSASKPYSGEQVHRTNYSVLSGRPGASSSGSEDGSKDTGHLYAVNFHVARPAHSSVLCHHSLDFNLPLPSALETSVAYFMFSECLVLF